ncbi:MAG: gfo/Idh/MocA family oxidoreductase, partial [Candidatus Limiplasma sp.]|nr:gfo/Idh/MocA family oxidoreductase [Candidatus Limiplasma sp.]
HAGILQNFTRAILYGEALLAPGYDGINELMISNAAYLSQWTGNQRIALPFDTAEFDRPLAEKQKDSTCHSGVCGPSDHLSYLPKWQVRW